MSRKTLIEVMAAHQQAERDVIEVLEREYPIGSWWEVLIRQGQTTPSIMRVGAYPRHKLGAVRFSMRSKAKYAKEWERVRKDVYPSQILYRAERPENEQP